MDKEKHDLSVSELEEQLIQELELSVKVLDDMILLRKDQYHILTNKIFSLRSEIDSLETRIEKLPRVIKWLIKVI